MSSSTNLYAASDSDRDSFSDELTPSDGYFNRGQRMSPNQTVQDPSVEDSKPEPKTLIAPPHLRNTGGTSRSSLHSEFHPSSPPARRALSPSPINTSPSHVTYSPPSSSTSSPTEIMYSEESPLVSGPPPAYSPTPALTSTPQQIIIEHRYSTFPQEEGGFLPARAPQSMGAPVETLDERSPPARQPRSPLQKAINSIRNSAGKSIIILLIFIGAFTILTHFIMNRSSLPGTPNGPGSAPIEDLPIHDRPVDAEGPYCTAARLRDDEVVYEFATGAELSVIQTTHDNGGNTPISTVGEIRLRTIPKNSKHGNKPFFTINAHVSDPELEVLKTWDQASKLLKISTPRTAQLKGYGRHCISLEIIAWFPEDSKFTNLVVEAISLTLTVMDDIKVFSDRSKFHTISGDIYFPTVADDVFYKVHSQIAAQDEITPMDSTSEDALAPFSSRSIIVETVSGNIKGTYPLKDLLGISSQSGSVNVKVLPAPADDSAPAPADLEIQTSSGSIKAFVPISNAAHPSYMPPARNYITRIHSTSGSISGSYYLGSESNFKTNSGSIRMDTLPVLQGAASSMTKNVFETHSLSGTTAIDIQDPIFISPLTTPSAGSGDPYRLIPVIDDQPLFTIDSRASVDKWKLHSLKSSHSTTSASITVHYPEAWEGTIHGKTVSGRISIKGEGLRILKSRKGPGFNEVLAQRGVEEKKDGSTIEMNSISGSLDFSVGELV